MGAHDPGQRIAISDGNGGKAERFGLLHQLFAMGGTAQKGKIARHL